MTKEESIKVSEENEKRFQSTYDEWKLYGKQADYDILFYCVQFCCENIMKSKLKGVVCDDFEGKVLDATLDCMVKIKDKNVRPEKLSSFCYFPCIGRLYDRNVKFNERAISLENWLSYGEED